MFIGILDLGAKSRRTYIEAAYNEFGRAMSATTGSRPREQEGRRKLSFARSLSRDIYEREVQDIMDAIEEDITFLDGCVN